MAAQVSLRCYWDEPRLYPEGPPMYILWKLRDTSQASNGGRNIISKA